MLVLHITDLHIEDVIENKEKKTDSIANILNTKYPENKSVLILFSGDIAQKGRKEEYDVAADLINELISKISKTKTVRIALCPGNHDRRFDEGETRDKDYVHGINKGNFDREIKCNLRLQENYSTFEKIICPRYVKVNDILNYCDFEIEDETVRVYSLNNSLLSSFTPGINGRDINRGNIFLRNQYLDIKRGNADYVFLLMHMPLGFLVDANFNYIKSDLSKNVDALFTGHIHEEQLENLVNKESEIIEFTSPALDANNMSGVSIILFDDCDISYEYYSFNAGAYTKHRSGKLHVNRHYSTVFGQFVTDEKADAISNIDAFDGVSTLRIPANKLFVFPKLSYKKYNGQKTISTLENFESLRAKNGITKILGDDHSGKSIFARYLFEHYRKRGYLPVICTGDELGENVKKSVTHILKSLYANQNSLEEFETVDIKRRILIIDNLPRGSRLLFREALKLFCSIIYTTPASKDYISSEEEDNSYEFEAFEIEPFYYDKRAAIYEKVYTYMEKNQPGITENFDLNSYVQTIEAKLKDLDISGVMDPSTLIYVALAVLKKQSYNIRPSDSLFQAKLKITLEMALKERGYLYCDRDIAEDILADVAMDSYLLETSIVNVEMFEKAFQKRKEEYGGRDPVKSISSFVEMLVQIEILKKNNDDTLTFYDRKLFAHYVGKYAIYRKNNYNDESFLKIIIKNGIYKPINLQILFSIATNYEYRTIPEFFVGELYDGIMKEPEMEYGNFDSFFKEINNSDDVFKGLEVSIEKRNEVREKIGAEEEKERRDYLRHKDDYFYYDMSKSTWLHLDVLLNQALIISSIMNNFASVLRAETKKKLSEMLIKIPYAIINVFLSDTMNKLDVVFVRFYDQLTKVSQARVTYQLVKQSIINDIHAVILTLFDICTRYVRNPMIIDEVKRLLVQSKDNMHTTQKLMLLSFSTNRNDYIDETQECFKTESDKFILKSASLIGRRFCLDNYEWVEKNCGSFLQLITKGDVQQINAIKKESKRKK